MTVSQAGETEATRLGDPPAVRALVRAAQAGDREAFDALVGLFHRTVFRTAMAALRRSEDAEDATQDAFVLAWRKVAGFRGDSTFKTWLLTIVWRQALDRRHARETWWRRRQQPSAHDSAHDYVAQGDGLDRLVSPDADPERVTSARQQVEQVRRAISALSPKLRDTLLLAASGEHTYDEIAVMLGVPLGTVKWRVAETRRIVQVRRAGLRGHEDE